MKKLNVSVISVLLSIPPAQSLLNIRNRKVTKDGSFCLPYPERNLIMSKGKKKLIPPIQFDFDTSSLWPAGGCAQCKISHFFI